MTKEIYVPAYRFPHLLVSSHGRVWSLRSNRHLKLTVLPKGYLHISSSTKGVTRGVGVHRLMLQSFEGDRPGMHACHKNGNSSDNRLENLYWGTPQQNVADQIAHGKMVRGEAHGNSKITEAQARAAWKLRQKGLGPAGIAKKLGITLRTAQGIVHGKSWNYITGLPTNYSYRRSPTPTKSPKEGEG